MDAVTDHNSHLISADWECEDGSVVAAAAVEIEENPKDSRQKRKLRKMTDVE